jgi:hypothetical protein
MKRNPALLLMLILLVARTLTAAAQLPVDAFKSDLQQLTRSPSRVVGSAGYYEASQYIEREITKLTGVELKKHEFAVMVPVTQSATLSLHGREEKVYPFWPAAIRVNATPAEGITGHLVYCGECRYEEIKPASLAGQIAVVEASSRNRWTEAFYFGAKAVLILGAADTTWSDLSTHDVRIPANLPRFFVPEGALADELRKGVASPVTLKAQVTWERKTAINYYALVKPSPGALPKWQASLPPAAMMFSVGYDSSSLVPDLSPGASQAVQTAAGLALLRDAASNPWERPLIVFFSGADTLQFQGTRNMMLALADPPVQWRQERETLEEKLKGVQNDLAVAKEFADAPEKLLPQPHRELIKRCSALVETDMFREQDQLFRLRRQVSMSDAQRDEIKRLQDRQIELSRLRFELESNPALLATSGAIPQARKYLHHVLARLGGVEGTEGLSQQYQARMNELQARVDLYEWLAGATGRPKDPAKTQSDSRLIELLVGIDLSDRGSNLGPAFFGAFQRATGMAQIQLYRDWFSLLPSKLKNDPTAFAWWDGIRDRIDFEPFNQSYAQQTYLAAPLPIPSELAQAWGVPGLSMITLDDSRICRDTPLDTLERINVEPIVKQFDAMRVLFRNACVDPKFRGPVDIKRQQTSLTGQVVAPSPGKPIPDLPQPGFLVTYYPLASKDKKIPSLGALSWTLGMRRCDVRDCDAEGNYRIEGLPRLRNTVLEGNARAQTDMQLLGVHVYRLDPASGAIVATTDLGKQAGDIKWAVDIKTDVLPLRSLAFACEEFTLTGLYDPRFLQSLAEVLPLDARTNSEPQRFGMMLANQMLTGFAEPGTPLYLLIRYGRIGNRLILINLPDAKAGGRDGAGYTPEQLRNLGPLATVTSRDFHNLDSKRLESYRKAGVSSALVDEMHAQAGKQLEQAQIAARADLGVDVIRNATGAWANEARVYDAAQDMARDVIRAAVFLLILAVPFSFCMERLLIGTANIYKQIAGMIGIFAVMAGALWTFHPAFKISGSPLIIILAFAIILMSSVVISVVYSRFDTELKKIRSGQGKAEGASFANASVMISAVLLGIANMRRRKFRTFLTSVTIVLITFAVLCFTGSSQYVGTVSLPLDQPASFPGIMLRQRGYRPMSDLLADQLRAAMADSQLKLTNPQIVEHWWAVSIIEPKEQYHLVAGDGSGRPRIVAIPAVLGISPGESGNSKIAEVIGTEKYKRLEQGEKNIAYIADSVAHSLQVREGEAIRIGGREVKVAGIFDEKKFDQDVKTLAGEPIAPLKYVAGQLDAGGQKLDDTNADSVDLSGSAEASSAYEHLSASQFAIVPSDFCKQLHNATLRSATFRLANEAEVKKVSDELTRRFSLAMYAGFDDGVKLVAASNLTSVSGASQVAIPLLIAGLIIFNTLMGSIAERKREIHIYTSLGLAPLHVGALFVAEAMTYGLIGTVFGYIIGQGVGTMLMKLGWLGSATLNYSGTSAMITMGLILGVVLLSALVPARLASKVAAPSIDRTWKVPTPKDDEIFAVLPFTINRTAADGALAYLAEFFESHKDGSIGKFSSDKVEPIPFEDVVTAKTSRGIKTIVWLTPFDLGVRQHVMLLIHPGQSPEIYEVQVMLQRLSGDDGSWVRLNKTFLTEIRKTFLQWRSLTPQKMKQYIEQSKERFRQTAGAQA